MVDFFLTRIGVTLGEGVDGDCLEAGRISFGVVGAGLSGLVPTVEGLCDLTLSKVQAHALHGSTVNVALFVSSILALPWLCCHPAFQPAPAPL